MRRYDDTKLLQGVDSDYVAKANELHATTLPLVNFSMYMTSPEGWRRFPRRLQELKAKYCCAIGTHPDEATNLTSEETFIRELRSEFFPGLIDSPVMTCNLAQGSYAFGFLHRLRLYKQKPHSRTMLADEASLEYEVRVDAQILPTLSYRRLF